MAVLRSATFEELSIRHTCCQDRIRAIKLHSEGDEELWEEDAPLIEKLRALLPEFEEKLAEMGCTLLAFLKTYWRDRMRQVCQELQEQTLTEENINGINRLGISLKFAKKDAEETHDQTKPEFWIERLEAMVE
ncbi:Ankyrin repeat-containing protein [Colletotrichum asianum]|uniref:Uncharacterized protein n=1 Tax=Colletotrichum asianum TaxID=702518 RepID=A0A8H3WD50_9PEZI|nr:hypothetical protein GQ607_008595 [Colletotrichum asianum]